jgi:RNA polymerase sigma-70 factor (ECF subfamily)
LKRLRHDTAQKRRRDYDLSLEELEGCLAGASLQDEIDARLLGRAIDRFLDTLPAQSRILFLRRYWFGDSVKDIAKDRGMPQNAVSVSLSRTREKLRSYLMKEGFSV